MYTWIDDDLAFPVYPPETNLSLLFTLGSTSNYWINGLVDTTDGADVLFSLTGPSGEICSLEACLGGGILSAGQYELHAKTFVTTTPGPDMENVRFSFDVTVSSVPIPASVWLFSSGLIGLIGVARRKKS